MKPSVPSAKFGRFFGRADQNSGCDGCESAASSTAVSLAASGWSTNASCPGRTDCRPLSWKKVPNRFTFVASVGRFVSPKKGEFAY